MEPSTTPTRSEVDDILKRKRKVREHKACYPCRSRKVKCDSNIPCRTCIERNHADICAFNPPPSKKQDTGATHNGDIGATKSIAVERDEWDRICAKLTAMERSFAELKDDIGRISGKKRSSEEVELSPDPIKEESQEPDGPRYVRAMEVNEHSQFGGGKVVSRTA